MAAIMRKSFAARVASRSGVRAAKPIRAPVSVQAFKVTLKTPSGTQTIEVVSARMQGHQLRAWTRGGGALGFR
jgi:hypothetical protein